MGLQIRGPQRCRSGIAGKDYQADCPHPMYPQGKWYSSLTGWKKTDPDYMVRRQRSGWARTGRQRM
jgi:hypothetical protein